MRRNKAAAAAENDGSMSLSGHLKELRNRIAVCVAVLVLGFFACLSVAGRLVTMLTDLGSAYNYRYVYIAPQELLLVYFNLALIGAVVLTFTDDGIPYDPLQAAEPDVSLGADERPIGGLGIFLVRKTMDEVRYAYRDGQNVLSIRKRIR